MDEYKNDTFSGEVSGFDSADPNEKKEQGYTVTPQGGFYTPPDDPDKTPPTEPPRAAEDAAPPVSAQPEPPAPQPVTPPAYSFLPNGVYGAARQETPAPEAPASETATPEAPDETPQPAPAFSAPTAEPPATPYALEEKKPKKEKKRHYTATAVLLSALLAAVVGVGASLGTVLLAGKLQPSQGTPAGVDSDALLSSDASPSVGGGTVTNITVDKTAQSAIEAVAEKAGPSVVGIRTTAAVSNFFGGNTESTGEGSGIIYSADGYIITNYHVIESAVGRSNNSKISVFLSSDIDTAIDATVVGYNVSADLAVIKIDRKNLPAIELGNSDELKLGQFVTAIGSPGGLQFMGSVSYGIISGLNRTVSENSSEPLPLIQTDAAINPGNSGGALLNIDGKLVGVNSVKIVSEEYEGMGFAIPVNSVKEICDRIIAKENEPTPYIGITISERYDARTLQMLGYPAGAVVQSVTEDGPAAESDIQSGDIIIEFNGVKISSYELLNQAVLACSPGDSVTVVIYRSGHNYSTTLRVGSNNAQ